MNNRRNEKMVTWTVFIVLLLLAFGKTIMGYLGCGCSADQVPSETGEPDQDGTSTGGEVVIPDSGSIDGQSIVSEFPTVDQVEPYQEPTKEVVTTEKVVESYNRELLERATDDNTYDKPALETHLSSSKDSYLFDGVTEFDLHLKPITYEPFAW